MKALHCLLLSGVLILAAGCSALPATPTAELLPRITAGEPAIPPVEPGPALTGRQLLEGPGDYHFVEPPVAYVTQQMTLTQAHKLIPMLSPETDQVWGTQTPLYLVAFRGRWEVTPMGPAGAPPVLYSGCLFVLFTAADGRLIAGGDTTCPGKG